MKQLYNIVLLLCVLFLVTCQSGDDLTTKSTGYLSLKIAANNSTTTKAADEEPYNPKQLAVQILNESGIVVEETDDYTEWENKKFELCYQPEGFIKDECGCRVFYRRTLLKLYRYS